MRDVDLRSQRMETTRWIAGCISPLDDETLWIKIHAMIKKVPLTFAIKFWRMLIRFKLYSYVDFVSSH